VPRSIVANAPGSVMLFGEHSVLRGGPAIVAAIDCRLSVRIIPRTDDVITVDSSFGRTSTTCTELSFGHALRFIEGVFRLVRPESGFSVEVTSSIDPTVGLGSSASVTVALLAALRANGTRFMDPRALLHDACSVIRSVQGHGSGADAASIIYGGVLAYRMAGADVTLLCPTLPLVLMYSGKKTPTPEVIRVVNGAEAASPLIYKELFDSIDTVSLEAIEAIRSQQLPKVGALMNQAQGLMEALGVGTPELSNLCWALRSEPTIFGAKISGSGLGDAAVGLGTLPPSFTGQCLPSTVTHKGVEVTWHN
jgi:mevalonate kinase